MWWSQTQLAHMIFDKASNKILKKINFIFGQQDKVLE